MIPATAHRVPVNTSPHVNDSISEQTRDNVARFAAVTPQLLEQRLGELDREWDVERATAALAGTVLLAGVALTSGLGQVWLVLPLVVSACLLLHAVIGWSPGLWLLRRAGFRTAREIAHERYALKAIRGDFQRLDVVTTPQHREDLSRFEGEGGAVVPDRSPDAADPAVVHEAIRAAQ
jgi:hypothetical protein